MCPATYAIAIGSNRSHQHHGSPDRVVTAAVDALAKLGTVEARAPIIHTAPVGSGGRRFANSVAILTTDLLPPALLAAIKGMERDYGRRPGRRWGPRVLDLDIILWSGGAWADDRLLIPHQHYRKRRFVLQPLAAIAPEWRDPLTGRTVRQLLARLTAAERKPR